MATLLTALLLVTMLHPARSATPTATCARAGPGNTPTPFLSYQEIQLLAFTQPLNPRAEGHNFWGYNRFKVSTDKHRRRR